MSFTAAYSNGHPVLSLEFFPPKEDSLMDLALQRMQELARLGPRFVTVTYGAGGGTRERTRQMVRFAAQTLGVTAVAHLTCVGHTREEVAQVADGLHQVGVRHLLALRGDPPTGTGRFVPCEGGFTCARELTASLKGRFHLAVAGYPEVHPEATSADADIDYLKAKVDAGAEVVFTQLFLDCAHYFRFRDRAQRAGVDVPLVPGLMPIATAAGVRRMTSLCGASVPAEVAAMLDALEHQPEDLERFGTDYALAQGQELLEGGAPGIHLYTLNRSGQAEAVIRGLGLHQAATTA